MHRLDCMVAVGGDVTNKFYKQGITTPELQLLRMIHGSGSISDIKVLSNDRIDQVNERDRLVEVYPKHAKLVIGIWRDSGGKFISDVRELKLSPAMFAQKREAPYEDADRLENEAMEKQAKATKPRRKRAAKKVDEEDSGELTPPPPAPDEHEEAAGVVV